ncbi:phage tail protein [Providencia sp.]|uniref:phage tail protein n=1 Tax=Providencia sp. TaxID=589 RepID=UPI003F965855
MKKIGDITNTADKNGEFTDGNVAAGTPPTQLMGAWFNSVQREILNVLVKAGIPQSATKEDQLTAAIEKLIGSASYLPTGYSYSKVESNLKFQPIGNYQPSGDYATNTALNNGLALKFDKTGGLIDGSVTSTTLGVTRKATNSTIYLFPAPDSQPNGYAHFQYKIGTDWSGLVEIPRTASGNTTRLMQVGDYGFGKSSSQYTPTDKISDYRINSISYAEGNKGDSFLGVNNHLLNVFGFTSSAYGYQVSFVGGQERVGFRAIINNVVKDWHEFYTTANTQADHNGNVKIPGYLERSDYPVGCPIPWPQSNAPAGYLICNGQSFNKTTYPLLAKAYLTGILPDLRGEFIRGLDAGRNIDAGRAVLSAQGDEFKSHNHSVIGEDSGSGTAYFGRGNGSRRSIEKNAMNLEGGNETRPRNIAFLYIVRAA